MTKVSPVVRTLKRTANLAILCLFLALSLLGCAAPRQVKGPGGIYDFRVEPRRDGRVEVSVIVDMDDPRALERYESANQNRIATLLQSQMYSEPLYIQVTFTQPLSHEEARELAQVTSLTVENYAMVGWDSRGEPFTVIFNDSLVTGPPAEPEQALTENQVGSLEGVMVIQGMIPATEESLGMLARDSRVYLVDTTAAEVSEIVVRSRNLGNRAIESVSLPSPAWSLLRERSDR